MTESLKFTNTDLPDLIELKDINQTYNNKDYIIKDFNLLIEENKKKLENQSVNKA